MRLRANAMLSATPWTCGLCGVLWLVIRVCAGLSGTVLCGADSQVYLPLIFHSEAKPLRTTACLELTEHLNPDPRWWEAPDDGSHPAESAFKAVLAAIKSKQPSALLALCDRDHGRDPKRFPEQAQALAQQFARVQILSVPRSYEFDGLVVFFMRMRFGEREFSAPFVFSHGADGSLGFLPYRTDRLGYLLLNDWFNALDGPAFAGKGMYLDGNEKNLATHRIPLAVSPGSATTNTPRAWLHLRGASINTTGTLAPIVDRVLGVMGQMQVALENPGIDDFLPYLTPEGGGQLKKWFTGASEVEQHGYKTVLKEQHPFFVFDAAPLVVVYTYSQASARTVEVMYFTLSEDERLLWTNSSHVTVADQVFKKGPLYQAALGDEPFKSIEIK